jgi:hypothetical protein
MFLQQAAQRGSPVLIPGALEMRVDHPEVPPAHRTAVAATSGTQAATVSSRERLEHKHQGGGGPSERAGTRPATLFARLWRSLRSPISIRLKSTGSFAMSSSISDCPSRSYPLSNRGQDGTSKSVPVWEDW